MTSEVRINTIDSEYPEIIDDFSIDISDQSDVLLDNVENVLNKVAGIVEVLPQMWRDANAMQNEFVETYEPLQDVIHIQSVTREQRRFITRKSKTTKNATMHTLRQDASNSGASLGWHNAAKYVDNDGNVDEVLIREHLNERLRLYLDAEVNTLQLAFGQDTAGAIKDTSNKPYEKLFIPFAKADVYAGIALANLHEATADNATHEYFIERILQIAENQDGVPEFPGLLELLATDMHINQKNSVIEKALHSIEITDELAAEHFISAYIVDGEPMKGLSKDVQIALQTLLFSATLINEMSVATVEDFIKYAATHHAQWPEVLQEQLHRYAKASKASLSQSVKKALHPYIRRSWIVPTGSTSHKLPTNERQFRNKTDKQVAQNGHKDKFVHSDEVMIDVTDSIPAIENFGVFRSTGNNTIPMLQIARVESIEQLLEIPMVKKYIDRFPNEPTLVESLRISLEHLSRNPFDPAGSKKIVAGTYKYSTSKGRSARARMRRFRPDSLSIVNGNIARKTRIFYDVLTIDGVQSIVLHSINFKQDIERSNTI
jgi:hypothetical protein